MKTIIVDDEIMAIKLVRNYLERDKRVEIVGECLDAGEALQCVRERAVEAAFLDICIHGCMDGVELGKKLKELNPQIVLIYTTGNAQYIDNAIDVEADFYLMKPLNAAELTFVVKKANELALQRNKRIFARTFGHFDLYIDGSPVMFRSAKAKELLALLVDREGGTVTTDQIIGTLWENRPNDEATQSLCSKIGKTLINELKKYGVEDIIVSGRGIKRLNTDLLECDLYRLLQREQDAQDAFAGDYMLEYSWAEARMASLSRFLKN